MKAILVLAAAAGALRAPRRRAPPPVVSIRGGAVSFAKIPYDGKALALAYVVLGGFDRVVQELKARGALSNAAARKLMHSGCGPLFLCCWPLFGTRPSARFWAMLGPAGLTVKAVAAGTGLVNDPKTVASMSRSGEKAELLKGPALYGASHVAATIAGWRTLPAVMGIVALCVGDAAAEIVGTSTWGRRSPRVPWCERKSLAGTAAFAGATFLVGSAFALRFRTLGWWAGETAPLLAVVAASAGAAAFAESFDTGGLDNPLIVAVAYAVAKAQMA